MCFLPDFLQKTQSYDVAIEGLAGNKQNSLDRVHTPLQQHAMVDCAKELSRIPPYFLPYNCPCSHPDCEQVQAEVSVLVTF